MGKIKLILIFFIILFYSCNGYNEATTTKILTRYQEECGIKFNNILNVNYEKRYDKTFKNKKCFIRIFNEKMDIEKETAQPWKLVEKTDRYQIYKSYGETKDEGIATFDVVVLTKKINIASVTRVKSKKTQGKINYAFLEIDNYEEVLVKMAYDFVKIISEN